MPAVNVAKSDTFEIQRQKINTIGSQIFAISAGGSDLSTGILKLGDGNKDAPSLAFTNDASLGFFKSNLGEMAFVSTSKKVFGFDASSQVAFQDFIVRKKSLETTGISISNTGAGYDEGTYTDVTFIGGTGSNGVATIVVTGFEGTVTAEGDDYNPGAYTGVILEGGTGSGATISFTANATLGSITDGGSSLAPGIYANVPLTNVSSSGSGAEATVTVTGTTDLTIGITTAGSGLSDETYTDIPLLNTPDQSFVVTSIANTGTPPPDNVLSIDGTQQATLSVVEGRTYWFDTSDSSVETHPLAFRDDNENELPSTYFDVTQYGAAGNAGSFTQLVIKPGATDAVTGLTYYCSSHAGMGGTINLTSVGGSTNFGTGGLATVVVATNAVSTVTVTSGGSGYEQGDSLTLAGVTVGGDGAVLSGGVALTVSAATYSGVVTDVTVTDDGTGYENGDVLSASTSVIGGTGSSFQYTLSQDSGAISAVAFSAYGSGYTSGDVLTLPGSLTASTTVALVDSEPVITVSNLASTGIQVGYTITGATGIPSGAVVQGLDTDTNTITIDVETTGTGTSNATYTPAWGAQTGATEFQYTIGNVGPVNSVTITDGGAGYDVGDVLTVAASELSATIDYAVTVGLVQTLTFSGTVADSAISVGDNLKVPDGAVTSVTPAGNAGTPDGSYTAVAATGGSGSGATFDVTRDSLGAIDSVTASDGGGGLGYAVGNTLTLAGALVGGADITLTVDEVTVSTLLPVYKVESTGGNIDNVTILAGGIAAAAVLQKDGTNNTYTVATATADSNGFFLNGDFAPEFTIYEGNTYVFDYASIVEEYDFALSESPDGSNTTVTGITSVATLGSTTLTLSSVAGIIPGMAVSVTAGDGAFPIGTVVESINGNDITVSANPSLGGAVTLTFTGSSFLQGVTTVNGVLTLSVNANTPDLYYFSPLNPGFGGNALLTFDANNPKVFGDGAEFTVTSVLTEDLIKGEVASGNLIAESASITTDLSAVNLTASESVTALTATLTTLNATNIQGSIISLSSSQTNINSVFNFGNGQLTIESATGDFTTAGELKTTGQLNVNDSLLVNSNVISAAAGLDIEFAPPVNQVAKVDASTAFGIAAGSEADKPVTAYNGYIRFNTDSNQYEGYSETNSSWSSLGGVRDLDGNTTILAEETVGADDNTLWFIQDGTNTLKFTPNYVEFINVKKLRSLNVNAPAFEEWRANTSVDVGDYLKYNNDVYEVTGAGTTATSGNEPNDTSGNPFTNGSATLVYNTTAVAPITIEETSEFRIAPQGGTDFVVNGELRLSGNKFSSDISDIEIAPNSGQKVFINATTSLVIPVGDNNSKGTPAQGSIRYNTDDTTFEGYDGVQWGSLGGVKDIDGDTLIKPESVPNADEDTLFFVNANAESMRLTTTELQFDAVSTITSQTSNSLTITAGSLFLGNNVDTTLDNTSSTSTFLHTSKEFFDIGLSVGLNVDPLLRLNDNGDILYNLGFGTGTFSGVTLLDTDLRSFELAHTRQFTTKFDLTKGTIDQGAAILYNPTTDEAAKVTITAYNSNSTHKEVLEFTVIDRGSDIFYTEIGNIKTGQEIISAEFDFNASGEVRVTTTLDSALNNNNLVNVTVVSQIIKK